MTIKISEVRAAFEAMTGGEWWLNDIDGDVQAGEPGADAKNVGPVDWAHHDLMGMLTTHNAMPVFLEVVDTLLTYEASKKTAAAARFAWSRGIGEPDESARFDSLDNADRMATRDGKAHRAALAKVTR